LPKSDERQQDFAAFFGSRREPPVRVKAVDPGFLALFVRRSLSWPKIDLPANWAMTGQAVFDETRRVEVEELTVGPTLQAPEKPAPAQILFRGHCPVLRC
jgi:hypothetical protein